MENKINLVELLEDCPMGMELDCPLYDNVTLGYVLEGNAYPIKVQTPEGTISLTKEGCYSLNKHAKCVIFPKGKTTWEGFQSSFKDGDVIYVKAELFKWVSIFKKDTENVIITYADYDLDRGIYSYGINDNAGFLCHNHEICEKRIATEEEKQKLFDAIKANGYKWNAETKTLEKLPKFKVGDRVKHRERYLSGEVIKIYNECYTIKYNDKIKTVVNIKEQDDYELVSNKFDITTLKPFDKVLVRGNVGQKWIIDFFGFMDKDKGYPFVCVGHYISQCIPYEQNKHLLNTTDDCDEFYKTWE